MFFVFGTNTNRHRLCLVTLNVFLPTEQMDKTLSTKLRICSFLSGVAIVVLHSPTLNLQFYEFDINQYSKLNIFLQNFIVDGVTRFALPFFFVLASFLYFRTYEQKLSSFARKLKNRLISLGIPYLLWSFLGLAFFFVLENYVLENFVYMDAPLSSYSILELVKIWLFHPYQEQLWFLPGLFKLICLSPLLFFIIKRTGYLIIIPFYLIWLFNINTVVVSNIGLLFFSVGAYFAIQKPKISKVLQRKATLPLIGVWLLLCLLYTALVSLYGYSKESLIVYFNFTRTIGIACLWLGYDYFYSERLFTNKTFLHVASFSFFIYLIHMPLLDIVRNALIKVIGLSDFKTFVIFILSPIVTIAIAVLLGMFMRKYMKFIYVPLSGNR